MPYDLAIPLLGIHTEETRSERDTCTPMFIAALFIIARTWKQPRRPSADEWIRKLWYIYTMEYYSAIKKMVPSTSLGAQGSGLGSLVLLAQWASFHALPDWVPLQAPGFLLWTALVPPALTLGPAACLSLGSVCPIPISVLLLLVPPWKGLEYRGGGKGRAGEVSWEGVI